MNGFPITSLGSNLKNAPESFVLFKAFYYSNRFETNKLTYYIKNNKLLRHMLLKR